MRHRCLVSFTTQQLFTDHRNLRGLPFSELDPPPSVTTPSPSNKTSQPHAILNTPPEASRPPPLPLTLPTPSPSPPRPQSQPPRPRPQPHIPPCQSTSADALAFRGRRQEGVVRWSGGGCFAGLGGPSLLVRWGMGVGGCGGRCGGACVGGGRGLCERGEWGEGGGRGRAVMSPVRRK